MKKTPAQRLFLQALPCAVRNERVDWTQPVDGATWDALMAFAATQKMQPLIFEAVCTCPAAAGWEHRADYGRRTIRHVVSQTARSERFATVYRALCAAGFHPLCVKGTVCRSVYPAGAHRSSGDEDIYVPDTEFAGVCRLLRERGMMPDRTDETADEIGWTEGELLRLEVHRRLFSCANPLYAAMEDFFADAPERAEEYDTDAGRVRSFDPHDHLLYLLLHAYKHFIVSGFGVRQVCDIGLWAERYRDRIRWDDLYEQCRSVRALSFAAAVFRLAEQYGGIPLGLPAPWDAVEVDAEPMLRDLLEGGVYGASSYSRLHSSTFTVGAVEQQDTGKKRGMAAAVFPARRRLEGQYPVLKRWRVLLPAVWAVRLVRYGMEAVTHRHAGPVESLRIARKRKKMLRQYGIMP